MKIAKEIDSFIDHSKVKTMIIPQREEAIRHAIATATNHDLVVLAGKGEDPYQKVNGVDTPYDTDPVVAKGAIAAFVNEN